MDKRLSSRGLLLFIIYIGLFKSSTSYSVNDANKIFDMLFNQSTYDKRVLPDYPVTVRAKYNLHFVSSLDIKLQIMSTGGWFAFEWNDNRLRWENSSNGDIEYIYVPEDIVWHPELIVLNSVNEFKNINGEERSIRIRYNGEVRWEPLAILSTLCEMDVTYFPYDSQCCAIELASWNFPTFAVKLTFLTSNINQHTLRIEGDWSPVATYQKSILVIDNDLEYSLLKFYIQLERLPGHYVMIILFPTTLMAILTFVTFCIPHKSGIRVGYILTVVLSLVVLLTLFSDSLPTSTKHISLLVSFVMITLRMAVLLVVLTIFVMWLYHQPTSFVAPKCMHTLVRKYQKLRSRARKVNHRDPHQDNEIDQDNEIEQDNEIDRDNEIDQQTERKGKLYSNKELADFFDFFLFVVFTVLYIILLIFCYPVVLSFRT